ncbi:cell envelope integrity protein TolA, partial [Bordetella pertussis]
PPPPPPQPEVQPKEQPDPEIALEEARKKREQEEKARQAAEAAKEKARLEEERRQAELKEKQRLEQERRAAEKAAAEKAAAEKQAAEKKAKEEAAKKAAADKALRDAFRNDALGAAGIPGGTADRNQAGGGRDSGYGAKVRACVQPGVAYPPPPRAGSANPTAQYRVQLGSDGKVNGVTLTSSSGNPGFDRAVETGIRRCNPFPKPSTGRYEPIIDVVYRMYD